MNFLLWLEGLPLSIWIRESGSLLAFPTFLFVHTLGMAMMAGGALVIALALLGLWPQRSIKPLESLYPFMWLGFAVNLVTGIALFCADASTRGINPDFYIKMLCVIGGVVLVARTRRRVFDQAALDGGPIPGARVATK